MKIQFNTGNFSLDIEGDFSEDQKAKAMKSALKYIVQRDIASKVYIKLAGVAGKKAERILPKDFERESIEFTADNATSFLEATKAELAKLGEFKVSIGQHVAGDSDKKPSKEAEELWTKIQGYPLDAPVGVPSFTRALATMAKFDSTLTVDDYDDERGIKATHAYLVNAAREAKERAKTVG